MQISVSGQHTSIGDHLQSYVKENIARVVQKYFINAISTNVHFAKEKHISCNIIVNYGHHGGPNNAKSNSTSNDFYSAFDEALVKMEEQLRKYKSKLNHHHVDKMQTTAMKYIISPTRYDPFEEEDQAENNPIIIAEKPVDILTLSVSNAVMKMDLEDLPALMFKNSKTDRVNIVYHRKDGNISWIDSK